MENVTLKSCPCCSQKSFQDCCEPFIKGSKKAPTALALMRSRYSAYVTHAIDYLIETTHASERNYLSRADVLNWATSNQWLKLEIVNATENTVEFKAYFIDTALRYQVHHEHSAFSFEAGSWYYVDGQFF